MSLKAYNIDVPITPGVMPPVIHIGQYDSGRDYICHLKNDDGTDYTIPSGTTATFTGCNPRKEVFELDATVDTSANTITITPKDEATSMFGKYGATLNLTLNDEQMSPIVILMDVQKAGATNEEIAGAANFPDAVTEAVHDYVDQLREQGEAWPAKFICTFTTSAGVTTCDKTYEQVVEADTSQNIISCDSSEGAGWYAGIVDDSAVFYVVETGGGAPVLTRYELSASGVSANYYAMSGGGGLSDGAKNALLACLRGIEWLDPDSYELYQNLEGELFPEADITSIYALFTQGGVVYDSDNLDSLRQYLTVTAYYTDGTSRTVTGYTLSGTLTAGTSTITVSYRGKAATFIVTVTHKPSLDDIAYGTTTYREMFVTNNQCFISDFEMPLTISSSGKQYATGIYYSANAGSPSISADAYNSPGHSLKAFGSGSQQLLIDYRSGHGKPLIEGNYFIGAMVNCSRYSTGSLGLSWKTPNSGTAQAQASANVKATTDGFVAVGKTVAISAAMYSNTYAFFAGSANSANLDGYVDDVVFIPIPDGMTEAQALELYENYLAIVRDAA